MSGTELNIKVNSTFSAIAAIDRLLSLGANILPHAPVITRSSDMDSHTMEQLRDIKELLTIQDEESEYLGDINYELRERIEECEKIIKILSDQNDEYADEQKDLFQCVAVKARNNKRISVVIKKYERTISSLTSKREAEGKRRTDERSTLVKEHNEVTALLISLEHSFYDVHTKYERAELVNQGYKNNEEILKTTIKDNNVAIQKLEEKYNTLQQHVLQQVNTACAELDSVEKIYQHEILKLNAMLKKSQMHASSLQSLAQKIKDNEELTAIGDELINKVG